MGILDRHPSLTRPLIGLLCAVLGLLAVLTATSYFKLVGAPSDENVFADPPRVMCLYVTKAVPGVLVGVESSSPENTGAGRAVASDSIHAGDLIQAIDDKEVINVSGLTSAIAATPKDAFLKIRVYRREAAHFATYRVRRSDVHESFTDIVWNYVIVTHVTPGGASDRAGMKVGDLLLRINDYKFRSAQEADLIRNRERIGRAIHYKALRANEHLDLEVTLPLMGFPLNPLFLSVAGMFMMGMGASVSLKRPRIQAARIVGFALLFLGYFFAVSPLSGAALETLGRVRDLSLGISLVVGVSFLGWSWARFPKERSDLVSRRWIPRVGVGMVLLTVMLSFFLGFAMWALGSLVNLLYYIVLAFMYRRGSTREHKKMGRVIRWAWLMPIIFVLGSEMAHSIVEEWIGSTADVILTAILMLAIPCSYLYTIARYRLLDLDLHVRRNAQYTLVSVAWAVTLVYLLVRIFIALPEIKLDLPAIMVHGSSIEVVDAASAGPEAERTNRLALMSIAVGIWFLFWHLRQKGQQWIDRKYYRTRYDYRRAMYELTDVLARKLMIADLGPGLADKIAELVQVKRAGVFFFRDGMVRPSLSAYGVDLEGWTQFCSQVEGDLSPALADIQRPTRSDYLLVSLKEAFDACEFSLIIPVRSQNHLLGAIVLGEKLSEATYRQEDYEFLSAAADQAAIAMANASLYEDLADKERLKFRLELEMVEAAKLKEMDNLKSRFFANISHEFRTPLTLILGPIEKWRGKVIEGDFQKDLGMMERNSRRLLELINQLLDLSKIEAGKMELKASRVNIVQFTNALIRSFQSAAESRSIELTFAPKDGLFELYADRDKLDKILTNLLSNALKFTPDRGRVNVGIKRGAEPSSTGPGGGWIDIEVSDTGIGIPKSEIDHLFSRFYRVERSRTHIQEGTGIGLALARELAELHRGLILVRSQVGEGTVFTVRLPLGKRHLKPEEIVESPDAFVAQHHEEHTTLIEGKHASIDYPLVLQNKRPIVLVVEDNAEVRAYVSENLRGEYQVVEARDGSEGLKIAGEVIPDLIVSDIMMPGKDGNELCATLKSDEKTSHVPIILLTAKAGKENKVEGLEARADDYLTKPFDARELLARVRNLIEIRRRLRERFSMSRVLKPGDIEVTSIDDVFLQKAISVVERRMGDGKFGVEHLRDELGLSRTQLHRKITALTNQSAGGFIRYMRLQRAKDLLKQNAGTVSEIAFQVGFNSVAYFTKCFHEQFAMVPSEFRRS